MSMPSRPRVECEQQHAGLSVTDVRAAVEFYTTKLGFEPGFMWGEPPTFAAVNLGKMQIFLEQGEPLLSACEPYLLEGDPLAIVEVVGMAAHASLWTEKFDRAERILDRLVAAARDASAVSALIYPLAVRSHLDFRLGRWAAARAEAAESVELAQDTGQLPLLAHSLAALAHIEAAGGSDHVVHQAADVRFVGDIGLQRLSFGHLHRRRIAVCRDDART